MGRQLTTVDIKGTRFEVDAFMEVLRRKEMPGSRIPFQVFDQEGDGYRFLYDTESKGLPESKAAVLEQPERYCWVILPALMELDPEGIAMRYDIPLEILMPEDTAIIPKNIIAETKPLRIKTNEK